MLLACNLAIVCNQRTTIRGLLVTTFRCRATLALGLRFCSTPVFFGHFFSSVVQRGRMCCLHSRCSNLPVIPTTLMTMNASLSAANPSNPYSQEFISAVKNWVDQHFSGIVTDLSLLVTHQSLAFEIGRAHV